MSVIRIHKVAEPFGWMGNMSAFPIKYGHVLSENFSEWRSTEHLFQALRFTDPEIIMKIYREKSLMGAKLVAKSFTDKMIVQPRSDKDLENMWLCLLLKTAQHPKLYDDLLETGEAEIVEDCSNRRNDSGLFWGAALIDNTWVGRNELGKQWMSLRASDRSPEALLLVMGIKTVAVDSDNTLDEDDPGEPIIGKLEF